jgi:hypothetical protein
MSRTGAAQHCRTSKMGAAQRCQTSKMEQQQLAAVMAAISTQFDANLAPIKSRITTLTAKVQLVEASLGHQDTPRMGFGIKNDGVVSSFRTDVNKNCARIINVRQDFDDSFTGVQTSIGDLRNKMQAAIRTLKTMIQANGHPVNSTAASGTVSVVDNPATGVGIHLPMVPQEGPHTAAGTSRPDNANKTPRVPTTNRFHIPDGYHLGFRSLSFPSGNRPPRQQLGDGTCPS